MDDKQRLLRNLPAVDRILNEPGMAALADRCPHPLLVEAAQEAVAELRQEILDQPEHAGVLDLSPRAVAEKAANLAEAKLQPSLRPVINATGTLLHTNLGRAPLSTEALRAMEAVARSYSNLEFDLDEGLRGNRFRHVESLLCRLTGAEAATVVNNNAGAVLLVLAALSRGKEAVVSRGELIEIGGSFRVPDVMEAGGVILREVGTTNKTHLKDYQKAINEKTGLLLKVHTSNYRIVGFTESVTAADLVQLGRKAGLPVLEDLGSGMLFDLSPFGLPREPTVAEAVAAGIDVVTFSGDKLLGGPQAGLIVGRREAVEKIRTNPMARAVRIDKLTLAALEATLRLYLDRARAVKEIPVLRMLAEPAGRLRRRCRSLANKIKASLGKSALIEVVAEMSPVGGGALPLTELPGWAVAITVSGIPVDQLASRLRRGRPPVIGRIRDDRLLLNPRTLMPGEEKELVAAVVGALIDKVRP